jgi:HAE1 family hydrophobic/amphiphilic exporter-1
MLAVGWVSLKRLGVDLFPDVTFPVVFVATPYPGAGPSEVETLISKPLEEEIGTIAGIKRLSSNNQEGLSTVIAEFTLETDVKYAEQQIRDKVSSARRKLPTDIDEPVIRRIDPADQPVLTVALNADLPEKDLYDIAYDRIKPKLEQVDKVGLVEILGGRKREIHVALDRNKLRDFEISATQVAQRLAASGENIPAGKVDQGTKETVFRTLGEFKSLQEIGDTIVSFLGNDRSTRLSNIATITDTLEDEKSRTFANGKKALFLNCYRQSGSNTIAVVNGIKKTMAELNDKILPSQPGKPKLSIVRDMSKPISDNVDDVKETIYLGVALAVLVVFFFLGNARSTIITGLALPNSLIGSFILMAAFGFTVNIMTLLALSLAVGLLIDDAIVVRENIHRHIEMGKPPLRAASEGTAEVRLAVIATTLTVIAVFGPVAFLKGVVGQFFRQFGLTICFAMAISLFDALTIAPMLSAYFAGKHQEASKTSIYARTIGRALKGFDSFQTWLENRYESLLRYTIRRPGVVLGLSFLVFLGSCASITQVTKTFLPPQDNGEFVVTLDLPPGTNIQGMDDVAQKVDGLLRDPKANPDVTFTALTVGNADGAPNVAEIYVKLVPAKLRKLNTSEVKERIRKQLVPYANANPVVKDYDASGGNQRPFNLNIIGDDQKQLEAIAKTVFERLKNNPALKDVDTSFREGKPELQVVPDKKKMDALGFSIAAVGTELRTLIEGITPAKFRENGHEYDVRVRLQENQRNLREGYTQTYVPNLNGRMVRLTDVSKAVETTGPAKITRQDRGRYIQIMADIAPGGGLGDVMKDVQKMFEKDIKLPPGFRYAFMGQAENFAELLDSLVVALGLGILFIFLVLASLYESFVTPFTIMLALPLAMCGSFVALMVTHQSLNIFSIIGVIMLLGVATKNSILLVDYANQKIQAGMTRSEALIASGRSRLRPILMTTMALIAGTVPVAMGLNEASRQRTSMGVAIIGGLISSTLLTLVVIPAAFSYIDRFRLWSKNGLKRIFTAQHDDETSTHENVSESPRPLTARHSGKSNVVEPAEDLSPTV